MHLCRKYSKLVNDFYEDNCFIEGTNFKDSTPGKRCHCYPDYYGQRCDVPKQIFNSFANSNHIWTNVTSLRRGYQRRLIHALPVNLEIDLFEARLASLYDVVDVFVIGESNLTNSGGSRDLIFLNLLENGWLKPYHDKILYLFRGYAPPTGFEDGVAADAFMRSELTQKGLALLDDLQPDDLFLYTDGDELPRPGLLQFFKLHDHWPQPVAFHYKWAIFGFFWQVDEKVLGRV